MSWRALAEKNARKTESTPNLRVATRTFFGLLLLRPRRERERTERVRERERREEYTRLARVSLNIRDNPRATIIPCAGWFPPFARHGSSSSSPSSSFPSSLRLLRNYIRTRPDAGPKDGEEERDGETSRCNRGFVPAEMTRSYVSDVCARR